MKSKTLTTIVAMVMLPVINASADKAAKSGATNTDSCKARFEISETGIASSIWEDGTIGLTIPVENASDNTLPAVQVTDVKVSNATTLQPVAPVVLGDMDPEEVQLVNAEVTDRDGHLDKKYHVIVSGLYMTDGRDCTFTVKVFVSPQEISDDDTFPGRQGETFLQRPQDGVYLPPQDTDADDEGPNAESPILIPPGPFSELFPPTPTPSAGATPGGAALVDIDQNSNSTSNNAGTPPDPNAARDTNGVVLATFNTGISYSLDGGV